MVLGDAVSKLETFVWILNRISRSITWSLFTLKASYLVKWRISTWSLKGQAAKMPDMMNRELPNWLDDANDLSDNRAKWDWLKFKIKTSSITYSKKLAQKRKNRKEGLNFKYQDALNKFQEYPSEITRLEMDKFKNELETLYDERVEGIVVRARARWHEHGEKSSNNFLNLEKRNNSKKMCKEIIP